MRYFRHISIIAILAMAMALSSATARAVETPTSRPGDVNQGVTINTADMRLLATPRQSVPVSATEPQLVEFQVIGTPPAADAGAAQSGAATATAATFDAAQFSNITLRAYARFVPSTPGDTAPQARREGQVIVTGLDSGQAFVRLDGFGASWRVEDGTGIVAGTPIVLRGNGQALQAALSELDASDGDNGAESADDEQTVDAPANPITSTAGGGGGSSEQDDAKEEYKRPEPIETAEKTETAPEQRPERACIDGAIRVDTEFGVAFERRQIWIASKKEYADCFDSTAPSDRYKLNKNYASCDVRVSGDKAIARYQLYYIKDSQPSIVGLCTDDQDLTFDITEDHRNCQIAISDTHATPQADLSYTTRSGSRVQVRGCQASTTRPQVRLTTVTDTCNIRDEVGTGRRLGRSIVQGIKTYTIEGVTHRVGVCEDTDTVYAHTVDFEGCPLQIDTGQRLVTARSRVIYRAGNGAVREIEGCSPDTSRTHAIIEVSDRCTVAIDYEAGTATPQARLAYLDNNRREIQVRDCAPATSVRPATLVADTASCVPRADLPGRLVHERATYTYDLNGGSYTAATCRETGRTFALERNYDACASTVPASAGASVATKFRWSYSDVSGRTRFAGECEVDASVSATIAEDHASCDIAIDYGTGYATPQSRLVYTDRNGQTVEARGCAASTSRSAARLVANADACDQDIDLTNLRVTERASYSYVLAGVTRQASACRATGRTFSITRDDTTCVVDENINTLRATARYRMVFENGAGTTVVASDCASDSTRVVSIREDFADLLRRHRLRRRDRHAAVANSSIAASTAGRPLSATANHRSSKRPSQTRRGIHLLLAKDRSARRRGA